MPEVLYLHSTRRSMMHYILYLLPYVLVLVGGGYLGYRYGKYVQAKAQAAIDALKK